MVPAARKRKNDAGLTGAEYATLVILVAGALVVTAILVGWAMEQRGTLAPGTTPRPHEGGPLAPAADDDGAAS
jgi:Flp pilus assembly pilin Flp